MRAVQRQVEMDSRAQRMHRSPSTSWIPAALVLVLAAAAGWQDGGFWYTEALAVTAIAMVLLAAALVIAPPDRISAFVLISVGLLALWWLLRAVTAGSGADFLPLGASIVAFAAAFAAVRPLTGGSREMAALALASLGAVGALVGFAGMAWRWFPMAMPAQGLWRLSSSLTYSDAAGLVLGLCLLVALGCDRSPLLVRVVVCLTAGGLLATQSRGAYLAFVCACLLVPARRYGEHSIPLVAGAVLGVAAVASSPGNRPVPWLALVLVGSVGIAALDRRWVQRQWSRAGTRKWVGAGALGGLIGLGLLLLHHEIALRALAPSDQDRSAGVVECPAPVGLCPPHRHRARPGADLSCRRRHVRPLRAQRVSPGGCRRGYRWGWSFGAGCALAGESASSPRRAVIVRRGRGGLLGCGGCL